MRAFPALLSAALFALANAVPATRQVAGFSGYLISTFSDAQPKIQLHLSNGDNPTSFRSLNGGSPVLTSTVGTRGVRDIFLATNTARSEYFLIATDLDINASGFNWDKATRQGSRGLVVWSSKNLVDWSASSLRTVETATAGMAWAPSAVWVEAENQYYVFWASRYYSASDTGHTGSANLDRIRYATTKDFATFSSPKDYYAPAGTPVIDQEFQNLGSAGSFVRFIKNETVNQVYQESTTGGLFGTWTRRPGYVRNESPLEGPASYRDNHDSSKYYLLLDNYTEYVPYTTSSILSPNWQAVSGSGIPSGLKHGCVTPITSTEYSALSSRFG